MTSKEYSDYLDSKKKAFDTLANVAILGFVSNLVSCGIGANMDVKGMGNIATGFATAVTALIIVLKIAQWCGWFLSRANSDKRAIETIGVDEYMEVYHPTEKGAETQNKARSEKKTKEPTGKMDKELNSVAWGEW